MFSQFMKREYDWTYFKGRGLNKQKIVRNMPLFSQYYVCFSFFGTNFLAFPNLLYFPQNSDIKYWQQDTQPNILCKVGLCPN